MTDSRISKTYLTIFIVTFAIGVASGICLILLLRGSSDDQLDVGEEIEFAELLGLDEDAQEEPLTDEEIAAWIDDRGGHPDDPRLPVDQLGASDDIIRAMDAEEVKSLLVAGPPVAEKMTGDPRYLFEVGRIASLWGYEALGRRLLTKAASEGSAPAWAYLGYAEDALGNDSQAAEFLSKALELGFESREAQRTLALMSRQPEPTFVANYGEVPSQEEHPLGSLDLSKYDKPEILKALRDRNFAALPTDPIKRQKIIIYLESLAHGAANEGYTFGANKGFVKPGLALAITTKKNTGAGRLGNLGVGLEVLSEAVDSGSGAFNREAQSGEELIMQVIGGIMLFEDGTQRAQTRVNQIAAGGKFDGEKLAYDFAEGYKADVRAIYGGLIEFMEKDL